MNKTTQTTTGKNTVKLAIGAGTEPITVDWKEGDTVGTIIKRAGASIQAGQTATLGRRRVKNPDKTTVRAGETIIIAGKPSNG